MINWQSECLREKEDKDKLYIACGKLTKQLYEQEHKMVELKMEIEQLKKEGNNEKLQAKHYQN